MPAKAKSNFGRPPAHLMDAAREAGFLPKEPPEQILLLGHMVADIEIMQAELRGLMFAGPDYRSKLRVVRGAAKRISDRCAKLLGEDS
jgi:hypothetical protein